VFSRRQGNGLTLTSNYTLAHAVVTNAAPWDPSVTERYDSGFDIRHRVVFSANYELPFFRTTSGVTHGVLGGWQVNTVAFYQTGLPYTVTNGTARSNTGGTDRPQPDWRLRRSRTRPSRSGSTSRRSRRSRSTRSAIPARTRCTVHRSAGSILSLFKKPRAQQPGAPSAALRGVQHHEHAELRQPQLGLRHGRVREHHEHRQRHSAAGADRGEAAVLR